jgi:hypothetical protein
MEGVEPKVIAAGPPCVGEEFRDEVGLGLVVD